MAGADPPDLPRSPGSIRTGYVRWRDDGVPAVTITYRSNATQDAVRAHYRRMLRDHGWRLVEVELDEGTWEIDARRGGREAELEIVARATGTLVRLTITEPG